MRLWHLYRVDAGLLSHVRSFSSIRSSTHSRKKDVSLLQRVLLPMRCQVGRLLICPSLPSSPNSRWKECNCPQWDEGNLLRQAERQVERNHGANLDTFVRRNLINRAAERLRQDHDCGHRSWSYRAGGGRCESCSFFLPGYLLVRSSLTFDFSESA